MARLNEEPVRSAINFSELLSGEDIKDIPSNISRISSLLQSHQQHSVERQELKKGLLDNGILTWCCRTLGHDFTREGFSTPIALIKILCECCVGLNLRDSQEFAQETLPTALQSMLWIAWQIQQGIVEKRKNTTAMKRHTYAAEVEEKQLQYKTILDSIADLLTSQTYLVASMLKSDNFIRVIMEEDDSAADLVVSALHVLRRAIKVSSGVVENMSSAVCGDVLNELIYKVTTSQSDDIAAVTVKVVLDMIDIDPDLARRMSVKFKGLKALLSRWIGHGFDPTLKRLISILDAGNVHIAELARRTQAVKTIWAAYKGWKTRTRVKKLHRALPSLQSSFRRKRQKKMEGALSRRLDLERKHAEELAKKRSVRSTREKQLQMLEIVPARKVQSHIQGQEEKAATRIQSVWRGTSQRKRFTKRKNIFEKQRAAIVIQRAVRRFLARRVKTGRDEHAGLPHFRAKLTKERREQLQSKIRQRQVIRGMKETSLSDAREFHDNAQRRLQSHHKTKFIRQYEDLELDALLAKIHTEEEMLQNLPSLNDVTADTERLACPSNLVAMAAEKEHNQLMKEWTMPLWQKLLLKPGENMDPFDDRPKTVSDIEIDEVEEFLRGSADDVLF